MKFEFSAGGIVYKKDCKELLILVCQHSQHHGWVFPKGLIGDKIKKEGKEETGVREVKEETGVDAKIIQSLNPVEYWYIFEKEKVKKTVYYFLMEYISGDINDHDLEMENVEWIEKKNVETRLTYKADKQAWQEAKVMLEISR